MQIDWLTVGAQIVNFLVLVWLLQRFLYRPIIGAMERREARMAERLRQAATQREEAEAEAHRLREQQAALEVKSAALLAEARADAERERKDLEQAARDEVAQRQSAWLAQVQEQRSEFLHDVRQRATEHFYALARRALGDLAESGLEQQMATVFAAKLAGLDRVTRQKLADACRKTGHRAILRSRYELPANDKRQITKAIHDHIFDGAAVDYVTDSNIACGLELKVGSQTVSWSLDSYFDRLEGQVDDDIRSLMPTSG